LNLERAAMRGQLAENEQRRDRLRLKVDGMCQSIRQQLNTALTAVDDLDVPTAAALMDDLVASYAELTALTGRIARLERELA
jgi:hypothetical protein